MVEIFNYNTSVYEKFATNSKIVNDFRKEINLDSIFIRDVASHAKILDFTPKPSALTSLLGLDKKTEWAFFSPPPGFFKQRFTTPYLAPSLGSPDSQDADMEKIVSFLKVITKGAFSYKSKITRGFKQNDSQEDLDQDSEESEEDLNPKVKEGRTIIKALDLGVKSSNVLIDYVISRIFQFVQG